MSDTPNLQINMPDLGETRFFAEGDPEVLGKLADFLFLFGHAVAAHVKLEPTGRVGSETELEVMREGAITIQQWALNLRTGLELDQFKQPRHGGPQDE